MMELQLKTTCRVLSAGRLMAAGFACGLCLRGRHSVILDDYESLSEATKEIMITTARSQEPARRKPLAGSLQLQLVNP